MQTAPASSRLTEQPPFAELTEVNMQHITHHSPEMPSSLILAYNKKQ